MLIAIHRIQVENEGSSISMTASSCIPVTIRNSANPGIFPCKALEGCIYCLFFRTDQSYLNAPIMKGKDLRSEHGSIGYTNQLESTIFSIISCNYEKPWAIRRSMDMSCLYCPIYLLLIRR